MKRNINLAGWLLGASIIIFSACSSDSDENSDIPGTINPENLPKPVVISFNQQFPNATNVKWIEKKDYYVTTFNLKSNKSRADVINPTHEAWYTQEGKCNMSEQDISVEDLKLQYAKVWDAFNNTSYAKDGYVIDDIDLLKHNLSETGVAELIFKIEVVKDKVEYDLYFTENGLLVREVLDEDDDDDDENLPCPEVLIKFISQNYKDAVIVDFEEEINEDTKALQYEVEILRSLTINNININVEYELSFDKDYNFIGGEIDLDDKLEAEFVKAFASQLPKEELDKIIAITGEEDPSKWDIEIRETTDHKINIFVEVEDEAGNEQLVLIATINPTDFII